MSCHSTVLYSDLFVLRMRTLAIQYPDHWGKSAIPNRNIPHPAPGEVGGGGWGLTLIGALVLPGRSRLNSAQINVIHRTIIAKFPRYRGKYVRVCGHGCV